MASKPKGFLTRGNNSDREFLKGGYTTEETQRRYRIRQKTKEAFDDLEFLFEHLPERERDLIFERPSLAARSSEDPEDRMEDEHAEFFESVIAAISLIYEAHEAKGWSFEDTLWLAIEQAHDGRHRLPRMVIDRGESAFEPDLTSVDEAQADLGRAARKAERGELLTDYEFRLVVEYGRWGEGRSFHDFRSEQRRLRRKANAIEWYKDRFDAKNPWIADEEWADDTD